jgi:hypothetical protein
MMDTDINEEIGSGLSHHKITTNNQESFLKNLFSPDNKIDIENSSFCNDHTPTQTIKYN